MTRKTPNLFSIRRLKNGKKDKGMIRLLDNNQEMTFSQIAQEVGVPVSQVYVMNSRLEKEKALEERIQHEEEKSERLLSQMDASKLRLHKFRRNQIERLHFEEGFTLFEVSNILQVSVRIIASEIAEIKKEKEESE